MMGICRPASTNKGLPRDGHNVGTVAIEPSKAKVCQPDRVPGNGLLGVMVAPERSGLQRASRNVTASFSGYLGGNRPGLDPKNDTVARSSSTQAVTDLRWDFRRARRTRSIGRLRRTLMTRCRIKPSPRHLEENVALLIGLGSARPPETFVCVFAIFFG